MNYVDGAAAVVSETATPNLYSGCAEELEMASGYRIGVDDAEAGSVKEKLKYRDAGSGEGRVSGMRSSACDAAEKESVIETRSHNACGEELVNGMGGVGAEECGSGNECKSESESGNEKASENGSRGLNKRSVMTHFPSLTRFLARAVVVVLARCS